MMTMMLTGDYHYTAIAAARQVGMLGPTSKVVIIQAESEFGPASLSERVPESSPAHVMSQKSVKFGDVQ